MRRSAYSNLAGRKQGKLESVNEFASAIQRLVFRSFPSTVENEVIEMTATCVQLVYGTTLRLPCQFITSNSSTTLDPTVYVDRLQHAMHDLKPVQPRPQAVKTYVPKDLSTCTHVYVRTDAVRTPLQPPYTGPYPIIQRRDKYFTLDIRGRKENISIDRLKVAYLDTDLLPPSPSLVTPGPSLSASNGSVPSAPRRTRSGRQVHFPDRLEY